MAEPPYVAAGMELLVEIGAIEHLARSDYRVVNPLLRRRLIEGQVWYAG